MYGRFCIKFPQSRMKGEPAEPVVFSGGLNTNVDFSDFIFVKIYSKFEVRKQKLSLNHKKIKAI